MPIDTSIIGHLRPSNIGAGVAQGINLRQLMQQEQLDQQKAQMLQESHQQQMALGQEQLAAAKSANAQRAIDQKDQATLQQLYAEVGGDEDQLLKRAYGKVSPKTLSALQTAQLEHREKLAKLSKEELEVGKSHTAALASAAQGILAAPAEQRAALWSQLRPQLIAEKHAGEKDLPAEYPGDQWLDLHGKMAIAADKQIDQAIAAKKESREGAESAATLPAKQATLAGQLLGMATNQSQWDDALQRLPEDVRKNYSPMFSPEAAKQASLQGMTPEQRAQMTGQEATRTETNRHNREMERHAKVMEARAAQANAAGLSNAQSQRVLQIANQFDNEPIVKQYNVIAEGDNFVRSLGTGAKANAGDDQALLYAFAKAMDPGSVVREGEYATVQKYSQSWADTFGFKAARIFSNSPFLSDHARQMMKDTIGKKAASAKQQYDTVHNEYGRRIEKQAGVKGGTDFLTNYGSAFQQPAAAAGGGVEVWVRDANGKLVKK